MLGHQVVPDHSARFDSHSEIILQRDSSIPTYVSSIPSCLRFGSRRVVYFKSDLGFVDSSEGAVEEDKLFGELLMIWGHLKALK